MPLWGLRFSRASYNSANLSMTNRHVAKMQQLWISTAGEESVVDLSMSSLVNATKDNNG
jgi:hypothetical protein